MNILKPAYCKDKPSNQAMLDIFKGSWKSVLPPETGLIAGSEFMFSDARPLWVDKMLPGGFKQKSILELGPFEAYQTYAIENLGAKDITSIEANNINFIKCLILKQILPLKATFLYGDFLEYLKSIDKNYDLIWASGVLYHQTEPLELIAEIARHTNAIYFWTHYYDPSIIESVNKIQKRHFKPEMNKKIRYDGYEYEHYYRTYYINYENDIPIYWEGGTEPYAYWLAFEDIKKFLFLVGFKKLIIHCQSTLYDLPIVSFLCLRDERYEDLGN